jgi:hypothetical protein
VVNCAIGLRSKISYRLSWNGTRTSASAGRCPTAWAKVLCADARQQGGWRHRSLAAMQLWPLTAGHCISQPRTRVRLDYVWNVMAHAQKPDFVFRRSRQVHLNRQGCQFIWLLAAEVCASAVVMLDTPCSEVVWRVLATHSNSPVSPSLPLPCVTVCHHISIGLYHNVLLHEPRRLDNLRPWSGYTRQLCFVYEQDGHLSASQRCVATRHKWFSATSPLPRMQLIHYLFNNAVQTSYYTRHVKKTEGAKKCKNISRYANSQKL